MQYERPTRGLVLGQVQGAVNDPGSTMKCRFLGTQQHFDEYPLHRPAYDTQTVPFYMTGDRMDHEDSEFLPAPNDLAEGLRAALPATWRIDWVECIGSTNADLLARAREGPGVPARPWLLGSHLQEHGRGRAGRTWQNRRGANLMFSCAFDVFLPARQLPTLAPLIGTTCCEALRGLVGSDARKHLLMKWPNDLLWEQGKLAGILIETTRAGTALAPDHFIVIIGLGLNLRDARALSLSLDRQVSDWAGITEADVLARQVDAVTLVTRLAHAWYDDLNRATARGFDDLVARYARVDALEGRYLDVLDDGRLLHTGVACGIDDHGRLRLRNAQGEIAVSVGEISVRTRP